MKKPPPRKAKKSEPVINDNSPINRWLPYFFIGAFAFVLYGNTLSFDYALDDLYAITGNSFTQKGLAGIPDLFSHHFFAGYMKDQQVLLAGGRYRPLSLVSFAVEYDVFGKKSAAGHFFNVLFYALSGMLLFTLLRKFARTLPQDRIWPTSLPFLATLIFMAHPVHTEVVANIKGRDEIYALLGALGALWFALRYLEKRHPLQLFFVFFCFFLALLSKESAILWLLLLPLTLWFFSDANPKDHVRLFVPLASAAALFLLIRFLVLRNIQSIPSTELLDNPFIDANLSQKLATIIYTLGYYLKLLFYPHPLTWDYYPYHISLHNFADKPVWTSILVYLVLILLALWGLRNKKVYSFGILFYLIGLSLATNLLFPIGTFMAERFLYLPSLGFAIVIAWLGTTRLPVIFTNPRLGQKFASGMLILILIFFTVTTIARNPAWKDDYTLYTTDVETSANSAKGNNIAGQWYAYRANQPEFAAEKQTYSEKALFHLVKAVRIHPKYQDALFNLGNLYYDYKKNIDSTVWCYSQILKLDSEENNVFRNLNMILPGLPDKEAARRYWEQILLFNPGRFETNYNLALIYSQMDLDKAMTHMQKAALKQPGNPDVLKFLGDGSYIRKDYQKARLYWEEAIKSGATDPQIQQNLKLLNP